MIGGLRGKSGRQAKPERLLRLPVGNG